MSSEGLRAVVFSPTPMGIFEQSAALDERGWLGRMAVDYYCDLSSPPYKWIPEGRIKNYLRRRYNVGIDSRRISIRPLPLVVTRINSNLSRREHAVDRWVFWHNAQFDRWIANNLAVFGNLAFGYESASLHTFRRAKQLGLPCVLYQPIASAEKAVALLGEEARFMPELAKTLRYNWFPDDEMERKIEERHLADAIICASSFTKRSLVDAGVPPSKVFVEPYGVNQSTFSPSTEKFSRFSVVWASSYTQTKGIGYLLEALARHPAPNMELVVAGHPHSTDAISPYENRVRVRRLGQLGRDELGKAMACCHVHVFPTLLEGFGRNIIEAMASGLPVITTANCAGPDLIEDGVSGFIIPIRDVDAICEKLTWVYENPEAAREMGRVARQRVAALTQSNYRQRFADRIHEVWKSKS